MEAAVISPLLSLSPSQDSRPPPPPGMELSLKPDLGIEIESYRISQSHPLSCLVLVSYQWESGGEKKAPFEMEQN